MLKDEERAKELLAEHWLSQMECDHAMSRDRAVCCCGFVTIWEPTVGDAAKAWAEHALETTRLLAQVRLEQHVEDCLELSGAYPHCYIETNLQTKQHKLVHCKKAAALEALAGKEK